MSQINFFHNITKLKFNLDLEECAESFDEGDIIMHSRAGNAIVLSIPNDLKIELNDSIEQLKNLSND